MRLTQKVVVCIVILIQVWCCCDACWEDERLAFLQLQASFGASEPWDVGAKNCCEWNRIECDANSGRVTYLNLYGARGLGPFDSTDHFLINASLFLPFKQLRFLDLSSNEIYGCLENEGLERLEGLRNLEYIDLSWNYFNNGILSSLSDLLSLKSLNISQNRLKGKIDVEELNKFKNLKELNLGGNEIEELVSLNGAKLRLNSLETLDLTSNRLSKNLLSSFEELFNLKVLRIGDNQFSGSFNLTNLVGLRNLEELDLSGNKNISKFVTSKEFEDAANMKTIGLNDVSANMLKSLGTFPYIKSLKTLFLRCNNLTGTTFHEELKCFKNVEEVKLDGSAVDAKFFGSLEALPFLKSLFYGVGREVSCYYSEEEGWGEVESSGGENGDVIFESLGRMQSLQAITLYGLPYIGFQPISSLKLQGLCHLKLLQSLDLGANLLSGTLPCCLTNFTSLQYLDLSSNDLSGTLPQCLANMTSLQYLDLSSNSLEGNASLSPLNQLISIPNLRLTYNQFQIPISLLPFYNSSNFQSTWAIENNKFYADTESHNLIPKFQLERVYLTCDECGGLFPKFLYYQHNLKYVRLENIKMRGEFPYWLLENNTRLQTLILFNNSLSGSTKFPYHMRLSTLDISSNFFSGGIPEEIGSYLPSLSYLDMSNNNFSGNIPSSFGNLSLLNSLDLSNNKFSKELPKNFTKELRSLKLSNNSLEGQIFSKIMHLQKLEYIELGGNQFIGTIPDIFYNWSSLTVLDVSSNQLAGEIPNSLESRKFLQVLDLSRNKITGRIPAFWGASKLAEVYMSNNVLHGSFSHAFSNCSELTTLDLSNNFLTDTFSKWIGNLPHLSFLLVSHNNLEGEIPIELCKLKQLSLLDLSNNNISGHIPHCLRLSSSFYRLQEKFPDNSDPLRNATKPKQQLEFTTKSISYSYKGNILALLSGIDLSCNKLTGEIPPELGNLTNIKVLNLSHNSLRGPIPSTFSNLDEIESLDLSHNNLEGRIPPQLTQLSSISVFSVAYNNLSGKTPEMVKQFATFENTSYQGNPLLCGKPLSKSCEGTASLSPLPGLSTNNEEEDDGFMDMEVFYVSFAVSYVIVVLGIVAVLYINPHWRRAWFRSVEMKMANCYYFFLDNCSRLFIARAW